MCIVPVMVFLYAEFANSASKYVNTASSAAFVYNIPWDAVRFRYGEMCLVKLKCAFVGF